MPKTGLMLMRTGPCADLRVFHAGSRQLADTEQTTLSFSARNPTRNRDKKISNIDLFGCRIVGKTTDHCVEFLPARISPP